VRALARDLAVRLGTVGHLAALVRTRVGPFCLADAVTLEALAERGVAACLLSPDHALPEAPRMHLDTDAARKLCNGQAIPADLAPCDAVWTFDDRGRLMGLASADGAWLRPRVALGAC
jgi:tRNA pseudouridine55 synthase